MGIKFTQRTFAAGQLDSAVLGGRQDLQKYFTGASEIVNFKVKRQGFLQKRGGTDLISSLTDIDVDDNARLIPFVYDSDKGYAILFADLKAHIISASGGVEQTIDTPYPSSEAKDICYCQSGDIVFLAHKNHEPMMLSRSSTGVFSLDRMNVSEMPSPPTITSVTNEGASSSTGVDRVLYYGITKVQDGVESALSEAFIVNVKYPWVDGGIVRLKTPRLDSSVSEILVYKKINGVYGYIGSMQNAIEPMATSSLSTFTPSGTSNISPTGVGIGGSSQIPQFAQVGYGGTGPISGSRAYDLSLADANCTNGSEDAKAGQSISAAAASLTYDGVISGQAKCWFNIHFDASRSVFKVRLHLGYSFQTAAYYWVASGIQGTKMEGSAMQFSKATRFDVHARKGTGAWTKIGTASCDIQRNASLYVPGGTTVQSNTNFTGISNTGYSSAILTLHSRYTYVDVTINNERSSVSGTTGVVQYPQWDEITVVAYNGSTALDYLPMREVNVYTGSSTTMEFEDDYITPNASVQPPTTRTLFAASGDYPSLVGIYQQRLVFASTVNEPSKFWMSQTGNLYSFNSAADSEDGPITASLPLTRGPRINHLIVQRDIHMLAENSEWLVRSSSGTLSYKTITAEMQSANGTAAWIDPILCNTSILFVEAGGRSVREYKYNYEVNGFAGLDVSVVSASLFEGRKIVDWCYQQHPDSIVWCVMDDGSMIGFTFMPEHEVYAWWRADMSGARVLSVASTTAFTGSGRNTCGEVFMLVRRGDGYSIESIRPDVSGETDIIKAVALDSQYISESDEDDSPPDGFTAVDILTGEEVVTMQAGRRYIVGVKIPATLTTVYPEFPGQGTIQYEVKTVQSVDIRVSDCGRFKVRLATQDAARGVSPSGDMAPVITAGTEAASVTLRSRDVSVMPMQTSNTDGRVTIISDDIFGMSILSISSNLSIEPQDGAKG